MNSLIRLLAILPGSLLRGFSFLIRSKLRHTGCCESRCAAGSGEFPQRTGLFTEVISDQFAEVISRSPRSLITGYPRITDYFSKFAGVLGVFFLRIREGGGYLRHSCAAALLLFSLLLASCGTTAGITKDGTAFVNTGIASKVGHVDAIVKTPQGGSIEIHQDNFNGTEVLNTGLITKAANIAAKGVADNNLTGTKGTTAVNLEKAKGANAIGLANATPKS